MLIVIFVLYDDLRIFLYYRNVSHDLQLQTFDEYPNQDLEVNEN
ncbi:19281_t:CDS:2 [Racocetra persica]|uniref:19281_t:CDS:1 n=1 Tax=Racocetra persica TaxID=160502 RepID=A0ACA9KG96_9GLOM|nr:19281_t:CDS:2 [Racocetra persica]